MPDKETKGPEMMETIVKEYVVMGGRKAGRVRCGRRVQAVIHIGNSEVSSDE